MWIYLTISFCFSKQKLKKTIIIKLPHLLQVLQTPVSHCLPFSQAKETKKRSKFGAIVISIKNYVPNKVTAFAVTAHLTRTFWCCCFCTFWRKYLGQASRMSKDIHKFCAKIESTGCLSFIFLHTIIFWQNYAHHLLFLNKRILSNVQNYNKSLNFTYQFCTIF